MYIVYEPKDKYGGLHTQQDMVGLGETYWLFLYLCSYQYLCKYGHGLCL